MWAELAPGEADFLRAELGFFSAVTSVSGALYPVPKDQRRVAAADLVRKARPRPAQSPDLRRVICPKDQRRVVPRTSFSASRTAPLFATGMCYRYPGTFHVRARLLA